MLSTPLEQCRLRQTNVLLDVGNSIKRTARGIHVAEAEKCFGLRPHQLHNDLLRTPDGLEVVLARYRRMALDLDTRVSQPWHTLEGDRLLVYGMRAVEPSSLRGCVCCFSCCCSSFRCCCCPHQCFRHIQVLRWLVIQCQVGTGARDAQGSCRHTSSSNR